MPPPCCSLATQSWGSSCVVLTAGVYIASCLPQAVSESRVYPREARSSDGLVYTREVYPGESENSYGDGPRVSLVYTGEVNHGNNEDHLLLWPVYTWEVNPGGRGLPPPLAGLHPGGKPWEQRGPSPPLAGLHRRGKSWGQ